MVLHYWIKQKTHFQINTSSFNAICWFLKEKKKVNFHLTKGFKTKILYFHITFLLWYNLLPIDIIIILHVQFYIPLLQQRTEITLQGSHLSLYKSRMKNHLSGINYEVLSNTNQNIVMKFLFFIQWDTKISNLENTKHGLNWIFSNYCLQMVMHVNSFVHSYMI